MGILIGGLNGWPIPSLGLLVHSSWLLLFVGFPPHLQPGLWPLLIIITFPETLACPSSRFIAPHSLGDTILSTESAVAAVASLSPWLTPASPVLVPVRDFKFKLNFNAVALMFKVELPGQEVAGDWDSIVPFFFLL